MTLGTWQAASFLLIALLASSPSAAQPKSGGAAGGGATSGVKSGANTTQAASRLAATAAVRGATTRAGTPTMPLRPIAPTPTATTTRAALPPPGSPSKSSVTGRGGAALNIGAQALRRGPSSYARGPSRPPAAAPSPRSNVPSARTSPANTSTQQAGRRAPTRLPATSSERVGSNTPSPRSNNPFRRSVATTPSAAPRTTAPSVGAPRPAVAPVAPTLRTSTPTTARTAPSGATARNTTAERPVAGSREKPQNPILAQNLPDPAIVKADGGYYMVGTAGSPGDRKRDAVFTIQRSGDLTGWKAVGSVFAPGKWPGWAKKDFWAPEIHRVGDRYVAYYTARDQTGRLSIGAAWSKDVKGPYTDLGKPLIRDSRTGVIDSTFFRDDKGRPYVVWKLDGTAVGKATPIYMQRLSADGMRLEGGRHKLLTNDQSWEGPLVEAPWVVQRGGYYYMFYSGNMYNTDRYATGVARSRSPFGPYEKMAEPVLRSNAQWAGPGHGAVIQKDGRDYYVYHAWKADKVGDPNPRMVLIEPIQWVGGWPKIGSGTPSGTSGGPAVPGAASAASTVAGQRN